jgi:ferredoxin
MDTVIYWFSGSGNSFAVARDLALNIDATLIPMSSCMEDAIVETEASSVGFVFPLYDFRAPKVVDKFIGKFEHLDKKYIFAVCTYGIAPGRALTLFGKRLHSLGGTLSAGFAVRMPHNGIGSRLITQKGRDDSFRTWKFRCDGIADRIAGRLQGPVETSGKLIPMLRSGMAVKMIPVILKLLFLLASKEWKSLALKAGNACDGCGICARVCPVKNISMRDGRPEWDKHCAGCMGCLHWCPRGAIRAGEADLAILARHHPEVSVADMTHR